MLYSKAIFLAHYNDYYPNPKKIGYLDTLGIVRNSSALNFVAKDQEGVSACFGDKI